MADKKPSGEALYRRAHDAVRRAHGNASDHQCVDCGKQATDWALKPREDCIGTLMPVRRSGRPGFIYVSDCTADYEPKDRRCHLSADAENRIEDRRWSA